MGTSSFSVSTPRRYTHTHTRGTHTIDSPVHAKHNLHYRLTNSISDFMMIVRRAENAYLYLDAIHF